MATTSTESLFDKANELVPLIRRHADEAERERRLSTPVVRALADAGMFRLARPAEFGGLQADPVSILRAVTELCRADGAAGWCAMISGVGSALEQFLSPEAGKEIFTRPDIICGGVLAPTGRALQVEGGYRISGRWAMASGCQHADWLHAACLVFDDGPAPRMGPGGRPEWIVPYVRASDVKVVDSWNVSGLRGTGSHDFEISDLFVPKHRMFHMPPAAPTQYTGELYRYPVFSLLPMAVGATSLGIARAAIDELVRLAKVKTPFGMMATLATRPTAQIAVSEAEALLRSAQALLLQTAEETWEQARKGNQLSLEERAGARIAATNAATSSARAVDLVYTAAGGTAIYVSSPLQRHFRDVHAITQNFIVAPPTNELLGKVLLGVEADTMLL